jgi:hypothetical protein
MLHRVALIRADFSEELVASIIRVTRIGELRLLFTGNFVPSLLIVVTLMMEAIRSFETSVLARTTQRDIPGDGIPHILHVSLIVYYLCHFG